MRAVFQTVITDRKRQCSRKTYVLIGRLSLSECKYIRVPSESMFGSWTTESPKITGLEAYVTLCPTRPMAKLTNESGQIPGCIILRMSG